MTTTTQTAGDIVYVVPCGADKLEHDAPARDLYTAAHFAKTLRTAERMAAADGGRVFILSAMYGLVDPDEQLTPYDLRMGQRGCITTTELELQIRDKGLAESSFFGLLPRVYREALEAALAPLHNGVADVYEGAARGIGDQRHVVTVCDEAYAA